MARSTKGRRRLPAHPGGARRAPVPADLRSPGGWGIHLTGISLLAPHLTEENAEALLAASVHKTKREIQLALAARFPQPDLPTFIASLGAAGAAAATLPSPQVVLGQAPAMPDAVVEVCTSPVHSSAPARIDDPVIPVVTPLSPGRFGWQLTVDQETHDLLRDVEDLLGPDVRPGDMAAVLKFALRTSKEKLLQRKCAQTEQPRRGRHSKADSRHSPAEVRRAVWERDGGQCTFTSDTGHRCEERKDVQFDHVDPYARGGEASIGGIRLLCRAHNQYEAERTFGPEFMHHRREAARIRASEAGAKAELRRIGR